MIVMEETSGLVIKEKKFKYYCKLFVRKVMYEGRFNKYLEMWIY